MSVSSKWSGRLPSCLGVCIFVFLVFASGCTPQSGGGGNGGNGDGGDGTTDGSAFLNEALGYDGSLSGKIVGTQTTRASITDTSSAQEIPDDIDTENAVVMFQDVLGEPLLDESGTPVESVPLESDGTFEAEDLPVGVDFTVCADLDADGVCDVQSCVNIPSDDGGTAGTLTDVQVDPLTTLVLAKLHALITEKGLDPLKLPISPVALVTRVVEAYKHLFEETGIEDEVTLEEIENLTADQLAQLFDAIIPSGAQAGMDVVDGNLDLAAAEDETSIALAAAKVFMFAGFPIADQPEGLDLSSLGEIEGVQTATFQEFQAIRNAGQNQGAPDDAGTAEPEPAQSGEVRFEPTIFYNTASEPDRNFSDEETSGPQQAGPHLPLIHDYLLIEMARLQLEGRRITLGALARIISSIDDGLGARFNYFVQEPNFFGPPLNIFETADGAGKAVNIHELFQQFAERGFQDLSREEVESRESELRTLLTTLLEGTVEPDLQRLAGGFITDVVGTAEELSTRIRDARAHLPFSRTGPSSFFVVADGDPFRTDDTVSPISVDAELDLDGKVLSVTFNATGEGKYYLGFTESTQGDGIVSLHVRETGRLVHGTGGPARLSLTDTTIFQSVNGAPFADFVSETGNFFPGIPVSIVSGDFVPAPPPPSDGTITPDVETASVDTAAGPNQQIFVLATSAGPGAEPVRVDYDPTAGTATFNIGGRYLLQFVPDSHETGVFALFNEKTGRPARDEDPADFFEQPIEQPDGFEDIFNDTDGFTDVEGVIDQLPPDVVIPPAADETMDFAGEVNALGQILISIDAIVGLPVARETFTNIFGTQVANPRYNADGDPYYDDIDADGVQDAEEATSPHRPVLFNREDWRSTDLRLYYRRSDNNAAVTFEEVDFMSDTPRTLDGVTLVARNFVPRLNAFRFGRPNTAINLLTAFLPPEFFNGTFGFKEDTPLDVFAAIAVINLMMDQVHNVEATIDPDGIGPLGAVRSVTNAQIFIAPIGDPFVLLVKGFTAFAEVPSEPVDGGTDGGSDGATVEETSDADATTDAETTTDGTTTVTEG